MLLKPRLLIACVSAVFFSPVAHASYGLASKNECLQCHEVDRSHLGPSFKQVAARYRNDKTALDKLVQKVQKGGSGQWGLNNMPPQYAPEEEIRKTVRWILKLKQ